MTAQGWRLIALWLWFWHVLGQDVPWFIDHLGRDWGAVAAVWWGILAAGVLLVPAGEDDPYLPGRSARS